MKAILIAMALMLGAGMAHAAPLAPDAGTIVNKHGGGTDAAGCHTNHKTGVYHCH